jgi:hypothetical protein
MKQITAFFLAFAFLLGALPVFAVSAAVTGYCGGEGNENGISWSFDSSTGTLTITGAGAMENWYHEMDLSIVADYGYNIEDYLPAGKDYVYTPWYSFRNDILHAVVSDGITTLGDFAFSGCTKLKDVTLGKDLTVIGHAAFEECESLQGIAIPEKVKSIGVGAFYSNIGLTSVVIPEGVESLDYGAFSFCSNLNEITLPATLKNMNALCFAFCEKLASVAIPKDVQGIGAYTFYECKNMKTVTFAGDIKYINQNAFENCLSLTKITIPASVTSIAPSAFTKCRRLLIFNVFAGSYGEAFCKENFSGEKYTINLVEHQWTAVKIVKPTCGSRGYTLEKCENCGQQREANVLEPTGVHSFGSYKVISNAGCGIEGLRVRTCTTCGYEDSDVVPAWPHIYTEWTELKAATCAEEGERSRLCYSCGIIEIETIEKLPHAMDAWEMIADSTCSEEGSESRSCEKCGFVEMQAIPKKPHTYTSLETPPTCEESGYTIYSCHCGYSYKEEHTAPAGHSYSEWIMTEPGVETGTCSACGKTETRKAVPVYDIDGNGTAEDTDLTLLMSVLVGNISAEGLVTDLDFDGKLTVYDCVLLMQYLKTLA